MIAKDQTGKTGESEMKTFKLPEREFHVPLAKALIEQRKALVMKPDETKPVIDMLDALLGLAARTYREIGSAGGDRHGHLAHPQCQERRRYRAAIDFLWQIAISIEDGDVSNLRAELDRIKRELEKALAEGAPPEKVAELMQNCARR